MLRALFGEPPYDWGGPVRNTIDAMERFALLMQEQGEGDTVEAARIRKYQIWTEGLLRSLDELESSRYAALRFAGLLNNIASFEEMSDEDRLNYYNHIYFDKNAYIRLFSVLDKLGTLMNEYLVLDTENRMENHFSFFTVLRNMHQNGLCPELSDKLEALYEPRRETMGRLRRRRNMEIHQMNAELQDDLLQVLNVKREQPHLENISENMADLTEGWELVYLALALVFNHMCKKAKKQAHHA
ncbi:Cthe_2314 family HEPN domain-containing protein [Cohnella sp. 56]|uniref:Cthe_2314 family HEPN domain-containing protein n=1 Tax=Cohnella sp. 56 TaxID=3113722 RepID=UPI0030E9E00D